MSLRPNTGNPVLGGLGLVLVLAQENFNSCARRTRTRRGYVAIACKSWLLVVERKREDEK